MAPPQSPRGSELRVNDILLFVAELMLELEDQPAIYNEFLVVMKDLKSQTIDTRIVTLHVSTLFRDHPRLIDGFQAMMPHTVSVVGVAVELEHSVFYINAIKQRYSAQPEIYTEFLRTLYAYRTQQRPIREVLDRVTYLLREHVDLQREFAFFVPGAVEEQAKEPLNVAADKARRREEAEAEQSEEEEQFAGFMAAPNATFGGWSEPALLSRRVQNSDIKSLTKISSGGFGEVWLGEFQGERVAVKRLVSRDQTKATSVVFAAEIKLMVELRHPKITAFVGVEWAKEWQAQVLSEYEELGDLRLLLQSPEASSLGWGDFKCQAAIDVADALAYLHARSPPVVMEVLRAHNVLVCNMDGHCKLSVFAAARLRSAFDNEMSYEATASWLAPEIIVDAASKSEASVVYSFGALLCELDSGKEPLAGMKNPDGTAMSSFKVALQVSQGKVTPTPTDECPVTIAALARECLAFDAMERPTAQTIVYRLREILKGEL